MEAVSDLSERVGVYQRLPPYAAMSLGAGDTELINLVRGYAAFVNGGKKVTPTLLDRVQDRYGRTLYRHDQRACDGCQAADWNGEEPPVLADMREQVLDPIVAYQVTHMMEGVIERGTGRRALRVGKPLAGKTGTTDDYRDAIFVGFSPDLVVGVRIGFDDSRTLGEGEATVRSRPQSSRSSWKRRSRRAPDPVPHSARRAPQKVNAATGAPAPGGGPAPSTKPSVPARSPA